MKRRLLLLLVLFISICVNAQEIKSIGKLHLDMSFKEVRAIFPQSLVKMKTGSRIKKVYKINTYTPIKNHVCKDIRLFFYNDTLYAIYVNKAPEILINSLSIKYGKPYEHVDGYRSSIYEAQDVYKNDFPDFIDTYNPKRWDIYVRTYEWNKDNPIIQSIFWKRLYKDENNEPAGHYVFIIRNKVISECVRLEDSILDEQDKEKQKKELDGL